MNEFAAVYPSALWWAGLASLGLIVGLVAGMFGVGGGFILVPLLHVIFKVPMQIAVGTGLCQMIGTGVAAYRRHRRLGQGEPKIDWIMMGGSLLGVQIGAHLVISLSQLGSVQIGGHSIAAVKLYLSLGFAAVLVSVATWMIYDAHTRRSGVPGVPGLLARLNVPPITDLPQAKQRVSVLVLAYLGLLLGLMSGLLGLGGGVVLMPVLIYGIGMTIRTAAGTGILMLIATAIAGTVAHALAGHVHLGIAMTILAGSTIGAPIGATMTHRLRGQQLRALFGYLSLVTAAAVIWDLVRAVVSG